MKYKNNTLPWMLYIFIGWLIFAGFYLAYSHVSVLQSVKGDSTSISSTNYQKDVDVSFDFKYDEMKNEYENLFQTSAANNGLRMEFNGNGIGFWGIVTPGKEPNTVQSEPCNVLPAPHVWHTMNIQVENGILKLWLDGALRKQYALDNPNFLIDDVAVGTGFSRERPFSGQVKNFSLKTKKYSKGMSLFLFCLLQSGLILLVLFFLRCIHITNIRELKARVVSGATKMELVMDFIGIIILLISMVLSTKMQIETFLWKFFLPEQWPLYYEAMVLSVLLVYGLWKKLSYSHFGIAAIIVAIFVFLKRYYVFYSYLGIVSDVLFAFALLGLGNTVIALFPQRKIRSMITVLCSLLGGFILSLLQVGLFYSIFVLHKSNGRRTNGDDLQAVFQTNLNEARQFILTVFSPVQIGITILFLIFCIGVLYYCFHKRDNAVFSKPKYKYKWAFMGILCLAAGGSIWAAGISQTLGQPVLEAVLSYRRNLAQMDYYRQLRKADDSFIARKNGKGETYVFVIGESGNKNHCSAYGYLRDTTPWMKSLRDDNNSLFFENAYASYVHTIPSILNILTAANQYNGESNFSTPSLIEVAKKAGFKTYWFSNQNRYGLVDNPLAVLSEEADEVHFTDQPGFVPDEKILDVIEEKLQNVSPDENNLIIIHLMGSHENYTERLPQRYPTDFTETGIEYLGDAGKDADFVENDLNKYDATIKYTDENLQKMYELISQRVPELSAFVYMPDHGEDVYGKKRHMASLFTFDMARVPLVMRFSDGWMGRNAERLESLRKNREKPFSSDLFFEMFTGIAGIETSAIRNKTLDIGTADYSLDWSNAVTMRTNKDLQTQFYSKGRMVYLRDDYEHIMRSNIAFLNQKRPNTFLAIACDSVGGAYEAINNGFDGIEINVTVQNDGIMMGHGPEIVLPMTLDEYLSHIPLDKIKKLWLDTKLTDASLIPVWYKEMVMLDEKYHLKERTLIESSLSEETVKIFSENGWQTNFYLLTRLVDVGMPCPPSVDKLSENKSGERRSWEPPDEEMPQIHEYAERIAKVIDRQYATNISFWAESYPFIQYEIFPRLQHSIGYCSWVEPNFPVLDDPEFVGKFSDMDSETLHDSKLNTYLVVQRHEKYHVSAAY